MKLTPKEVAELARGANEGAPIRRLAELLEGCELDRRTLCFWIAGIAYETHGDEAKAREALYRTINVFNALKSGERMTVEG